MTMEDDDHATADPVAGDARTTGPDAADGESRRATLRVTVDDPTLVARAVRPDNTDEMRTTVEGDAVVTRIERDTTGGLHATVDDTVVNIDVATRIAQTADHITTDTA